MQKWFCIDEFTNFGTTTDISYAPSDKFYSSDNAVAEIGILNLSAWAFNEENEKSWVLFPTEHLISNFRPSNLIFPNTRHYFASDSHVQLQRSSWSNLEQESGVIFQIKPETHNQKLNLIFNLFLQSAAEGMNDQ
jgi:hypothetical protein